MQTHSGNDRSQPASPSTRPETRLLRTRIVYVVPGVTVHCACPKTSVTRCDEPAITPTLGAALRAREYGSGICNREAGRPVSGLLLMCPITVIDSVTVPAVDGCETSGRLGAVGDEHPASRTKATSRYRMNTSVQALNPLNVPLVQVTRPRSFVFPAASISPKVCHSPSFVLACNWPSVVRRTGASVTAGFTKRRNTRSR